MRSVYRYRAFGLNIEACLALPELLPDAQPSASGYPEPDVTIRFGNVIPSAKPLGTTRRYICPAPDGICLGWEDVGDFLVCGGREITISPAPSADESLLRLFLLGTTLALLLHQRPETGVFHASAVAIERQGVAFVGAKGLGKSTMASSLLARGHSLVADDILAADLRASTPLALPGFPHVKLWPDSLTSLGEDPAQLPRLRPELEKRGRRLVDGYLTSSVPLQAIFVLDEGPEPRVSALHAWDAFAAIMPHWYAARFGPGLLRALGISNHFLQCAALAKAVRVFRLTRPDDLSALNDVARLVELRCATAAV